MTFSTSKLNLQPLPLALPPLENGDRLTRHEFERRYDALPHLRKAELIEGVVYMPAALRFKSHADPHSNLTAGRFHTPEGKTRSLISWFLRSQF